MDSLRAAYLTPADVAERLGIRKVDVVYAHIQAGRLAAVNVGAGSGRPTWRVPPAALDAFVTARTAGPPPSVPARRKAKRPAVTRYF